MFIHLWSKYNVEFLPVSLFVPNYFSEQKVSEKKSIHCSTLKYALEYSVEYIFHTRFESRWAIKMISLWCSLDLFIISHFLPRFPCPILAREVSPVFLIIKIDNIFIIHHKIWIFHITVLTLITLTITVYDMCNLYCFIISMCIIINSPCIFTFSQYPRNQD